MVKTTVNIYIDSTIRMKAKNLNLNISKICENALKSRIELENADIPALKTLQNKKKQLEKEIVDLRKKVTALETDLAKTYDDIEQSISIQKEKEEQEEADRLLIGKAISNTNILRSGL